MTHDIIGQFCSGLRAAIRARTDFPAFHFHPFEAWLVDHMVTSLPPLSDYRVLPHPDALVYDQPTRFALPLRGQRTIPHAHLWADVSAALLSHTVKNTIAQALDLVPSTMHPAVALIRDLPGYRIRVHPDTPRKLATVHIYLARHANAPHIGVRFHRQGSDGEFIETDAVPYLPGSGYFFRRQPDSWHSVIATTERDGQRDSLMLVYFDSPKNGFG